MSLHRLRLFACRFVICSECSLSGFHLFEIAKPPGSRVDDPPPGLLVRRCQVRVPVPHRPARSVPTTQPQKELVSSHPTCLSWTAQLADKAALGSVFIPVQQTGCWPADPPQFCIGRMSARKNHIRGRLDRSLGYATFTINQLLNPRLDSVVVWDDSIHRLISPVRNRERVSPFKNSPAIAVSLSAVKH